MKVSMTSQEPLKLFRADISPYQANNYGARERALLQDNGFTWSEELTDADILITNTHTLLDRFSQSELNNLKLVIHPNSGYDNFTPAQIEALPCPLILGNQIRAKSVTNYALASLFHALGTPPWQPSWDKARAWSRRSLEFMQVQIIGHGHIGKLLEAALAPISKKICVYDPYQDQMNLDLKNADIILFACSLNRANHNFLNQARLSELKDDCIIINPARGKLINRSELIKWLNDHPRAQAYLDVFEEEPTDLSKFPSNAFCTSHIAGVDDKLDERIMNFVLSVCQDFKQLSSNDFTQKWQNAILAKRIVAGEFI